MIAILPLYAGYWFLGRTVSLSPLEIARAFDAPVCEGLDGNASAGDVDIGRGGRVVRYGVLEGVGGKRLRVGEGVREVGEGEVLG